MWAFELTVFGYIRQEIESELEWNIPDGVKQLCFLFHGNFIMDSTILKPNDVSCLGYILLDVLHKNGLKLIKLFDTNVQGFDEAVFTKECREISKMTMGHSHSIGIIRTNYGHVFVSYSMNDWRQNEDLYENKHVISFLFDKSYETTPRILDDRIYVFPNNFDCSVFRSKKVKDIFRKQSRNGMLFSDFGETDFPGNEKIKKFFALPDCIKIEQFEMFEVCRH